MGADFQALSLRKTNCDIHHDEFRITPRHDKTGIGILKQGDVNDFKLKSTSDSKPFVNVHRLPLCFPKRGGITELFFILFAL